MIDIARKLAFLLIGYGGLGALAKPLVGGVGVILMLHRVSALLDRPDGPNRHLTITPGFLDVLIGEMKRLGYAFVSMDEVVGRLSSGRTKGPFAALTADDAYRDNLIEALPVLESHGAPITIYVAPGLTSGAADLWWEVLDDIVEAGKPVTATVMGEQRTFECTTPRDRKGAFLELSDWLTSEVSEEDQRQVLRGLAEQVGVDASAPNRDLLMDWTEIRRAASHKLVTIGAHTVHHCNLKRLEAGKALREMHRSRSLIEAELGEAPQHFAYPYGYAAAAGMRETHLARQAGFVSAVTTRHGVLVPGHAAHMHALPRISVNGRYQDLASMRAMLSGATTLITNGGRKLVTV
ncbi:polysaccharide deacetylase family protein [Aminobacter sp. NyZ550]|jgi:peptidoglycan/xylan/chitin deacetylase (PgdA/CDA1 family)|uniref:polysaccharide deacetylase family protein n=1 Tax=unclassified Aminobacter TaxID=2644704 RepID=UPI0012B12F48|nr:MULTISPECIES: polysaccharide deacetylase family protein [unclassified Aminobacter]MRX34262.1 polysaccharide deacetylase family protein [Aminobacter sp. MDW-2]QNH32983.1 polysaccharide deacetylase family protein [Aminobacter sp. MDW-2]WAX93926.1 polysaccharide deacetylase family protein [Aminobacter sp. NyZ550]BBD37560.1 polysaccharide deacetylase [Aminobacter sp. SS-2016]